MNIFALTYTELLNDLNRRYGKGAFHAAALYREIFKNGNTRVAEFPDFERSPAFARRLAEGIHLPSCRIIDTQEDGVIKFASALADGLVIESVIIPTPGRTTLCISCQAGCKMGCRFCATGEMGFGRNLSVEEIVWQVHAARFSLQRRVDNIVFMGMGEPFDNFNNVIQAIRVINDQRGLDIALKQITISTAGHAEGIRKLGALNLPKLRLAVSLNAADNALRSQLMPINTKYPLGRLKEELLAYPLGRKGVFLIEYVLLAGVNDTPEDAQKLIHYLDGLPVRINVIAYNGGSSMAFNTPTPERYDRFCEWLSEEKMFVCRRQSYGRGIMAGCGQLGASLSVHQQENSL